MAKFRLQVLAPGTWTVGQNPDGSARTHTFTREEIKAKAHATAAMMAAGINLPTCFEHQDRVKPVQMSRDELIEARTKGVNGRGEKLYIDKKTGTCFADVEVPHDDDAKSVEAIRFCSPEIDDFEDGKQTKWGTVFTHLAFTPKPVQHDQTPILRLGHETRMRLAFDPKKGNDMADEKKPDAAPPAEGEKKPDGDAPVPAKVDDPPQPGASDPAEGGGRADPRLVGALKSMGLNVPKSVVTQCDLAICVESQASHMLEKQQPDPDPMELEEVSPGQGGAGAAATPMLMSLAEQKLVDNGVNQIEKELDDLLTNGRAKPPEIAAQKRSLRDKVTNKRLSLDKAANVQGFGSVRVWIDARKTLDPGSVFPLTAEQNKTRLSVQVIEPPAHGELTDERKAVLKAHAKEAVHGKQK